MLDKDMLDDIYRNIEDGGYLDDWVLNCARAMRDQAIAAIDLAAENARLKAKLDAVRAECKQSLQSSRGLSAKLSVLRLLAILDGDGDAT